MTNSHQRPEIIFICKNGKGEQIVKWLEKDFIVACKEKCHQILFHLRTKETVAIIAFFGHKTEVDLELYDKINRCAEYIPKVAIIKNEEEIEIIRKCGEAGFTKVMLYYDFINTTETLIEFISDTSIKIRLEDIGLHIHENMPSLLQQGLRYIEKEYIKLKSIEEICSYLDTSFKTLSCHLKMAMLPTPKVILMYLKIRHSLFLLKENGLSNKEIANKSGFTDEKRFSECMKRMFNKTPGECRSLLFTQTVDELWQAALSGISKV